MKDINLAHVRRMGNPNDDHPDNASPPPWLAWMFIGITVAIILAVLYFAGSAPAYPADCAIKIDRHERYVSQRVKKQVFKEAGIAWEQRKGFVVDHRVPLRLGGTNERQNLMIQTKEDGVRKDILEGWLHRCVCLGVTPLGVATAVVSTPGWKQIDIRGDCPESRR